MSTQRETASGYTNVRTSATILVAVGFLVLLWYGLGHVRCAGVVQLSNEVPRSKGIHVVELLKIVIDAKSVRNGRLPLLVVSTNHSDNEITVSRALSDPCFRDIILRDNEARYWTLAPPPELQTALIHPRPRTMLMERISWPPQAMTTTRIDVAIGPELLRLVNWRLCTNLITRFDAGHWEFTTCQEMSTINTVETRFEGVVLIVGCGEAVVQK